MSGLADFHYTCPCGFITWDPVAGSLHWETCSHAKPALDRARQIATERMETFVKDLEQVNSLLTDALKKYKGV